MKAAKIASYLVLALVVSLSAVGCRRNPQRTTAIPGLKPGTIGDSSSSPRTIDSTPRIPVDTGVGNNANPFGNNLDPNKGDGLKAAKGDFSNWAENRDEFKNQTIYFEFDKSTIKPSEVSKLEEVVRKMKTQFQGKALRIEGHCDERGTEEYNRSLGDRRALSIREKLATLGLDPEMLPTVSFGEDKPVDPGHSESSWSKNRRGELILLSPPAN
jgi:outer membrane protein OmpA-like peptidoglycan-associated protein